jgi:cobaltochelatase CobT
MKKSDINPFLGTVRGVAIALGRKHGIEVKFEGSNARTDGNTIYLPATLPADNDDLIPLVRGNLDHESAHIRFTDFNLPKPAKPVIHTLTNIIEDIRIERALGEEYPGCAVNLRENVTTLKKLGDIKMPPKKIKDPITAALAHLSYTSRVKHLRNDIADTASAWRSLCEEIFGRHVTRLIDQAIDAIPSCTSTADCRQLAEEVFDILQKASEEPPPPEVPPQPEPPQQEQQGQEEGQGGSGQGEKSDQQDQQKQSGDSQGDGKMDDSNPSNGANSADQDASQDASGQGSDQNADQDSSQSGGQDGNQNQQNPTSQSDSNSQPQEGDDSGNGSGQGQVQADNGTGGGAGSGTDTRSFDEIKEAIDSLLTASEADLAKAANSVDTGSLAASKLEKAANGTGQDEGLCDDSKQTGEVHAIKNRGQHESNIINQMAAKTVRHRAKLAGLFQATRMKRHNPQLNGNRIDSRSVHRLAAVTPDTRIFQSRNDKVANNTAISIVVDKSGSMNYNPGQMDLALASSLSIAKAVESMPGVTVSVAAFPYNDGVLMLKDFNEPVKSSQFAINAGGGTPTATALRWAGQKLWIRQETRKIVLCLTDGDPDSPSKSRAMATLLRDNGIETYAIGIGAGTGGMCTRCIGCDSQEITDITQLADAMFTTLTKAMT